MIIHVPQSMQQCTPRSQEPLLHNRGDGSGFLRGKEAQNARERCQSTVGTHSLYRFPERNLLPSPYLMMKPPIYAECFHPVFPDSQSISRICPRLSVRGDLLATSCLVPPDDRRYQPTPLDTAGLFIATFIGGYSLFHFLNQPRPAFNSITVTSRQSLRFNLSCTHNPLRSTLCDRLPRWAKS